MLAAALLVWTLQQSAVQPPADTSKRPARDTVRLSTVEVREREDRGRRYSSTWSPTALKISTPLRDTPLPITVITLAQLRDQSTLSMSEALRYAPGVTMGQGEGHRDAPTIRGNASTADFFIDGLRDDAQYFRDLYNAERIEALSGPNALTFGRGGGGGVINRVTKRAGFNRNGKIALEGGSFNHARGTVDVGGALSQRVAGRLNALYQHSRSFRDAFVNTRLGISPQTTVALSPATTARFGAEYFSDERTVDRGLPSLGGLPSAAPRSLFFGHPDSSYAEARVMRGDAVIEHQANDRVSMRSQLRFTHYTKFYQNVYPGSSVDATASTVKLAAYNSKSDRSNFFSQSELTVRIPPARFPQMLLIGIELGRQATDNLRKTGYFNGSATSLSVPFEAPTVATPVSFRPSASDANNFVLVRVASLYVQDLLSLTPKIQATVGARVERFDIHYRNNRAPQVLDRRENMVSPRAGLVFKPIEPVSLYTSVSVSHLPSSGDQFSSLTPTTQTLEPERFTNREVGVKWSVLPALSVNAAAYRLMRTNTAAPSAVDPGVYVQTGRQRTTGYEFSLSGRLTSAWDVIGAFTSQTAEIVSLTTAAPAGATVPLVPHHTASLWNRYQVRRDFGFGLGSIYQGKMFAGIDNAVTLPGFWRFDGAAYVSIGRGMSVQANVENVFDRAYYATSHGNNNIMPGAPRTLRVSVRTETR